MLKGKDSKKTTRKDKEPSHAAAESTRLCLLAAAKKVFARCGFEGASVRNLAEEAEANVSAISYHFEGKEGLYRAILEPAAERANRVAEQTLKKPTSTADFRARLKLFIEQFMRMHLDDPEIGEIVLRDFPGSNPVAHDVFVKSFLPLGNALRVYLESAQKAKVIHPNFDAEVVSALIMASISGVCRFETIRKAGGLSAFLGEKNIHRTISSIVGAFCDGMLTRPDHKDMK